MDCIKTFLLFNMSSLVSGLFKHFSWLDQRGRTVYTPSLTGGEGSKFAGNFGLGPKYANIWALKGLKGLTGTYWVYGSNGPIKP